MFSLIPNKLLKIVFKFSSDLFHSPHSTFFVHFSKISFNSFSMFILSLRQHQVQFHILPVISHNFPYSFRSNRVLAPSPVDLVFVDYFVVVPNGAIPIPSLVFGAFALRSAEMDQCQWLRAENIYY
jgi:hypothetical protein